MTEQKFCQSCAMPMENAEYGTEADGSTSADYCKYCYDNGKFTSDVDMQGMIEECVPIMVEHGMPEAEARGMMEKSFPTLKRWKQ